MSKFFAAARAAAVLLASATFSSQAYAATVTMSFGNAYTPKGSVPYSDVHPNLSQNFTHPVPIYRYEENGYWAGKTNEFNNVPQGFTDQQTFDFAPLGIGPDEPPGVLIISDCCAHYPFSYSFGRIDGGLFDATCFGYTADRLDIRTATYDNIFAESSVDAVGYRGGVEVARQSTSGNLFGWGGTGALTTFETVILNGFDNIDTLVIEANYTGGFAETGQTVAELLAAGGIYNEGGYDVEGTINYVRFASADSVTAVPVPAAGLLLIGALGFAGLAGRKRA